MQKLEASLEILESRLSSIPGLEQEHQKESNNVNETNMNKLEEVEVSGMDEADDSQIKPKDEEKEVQSAAKDPRYEKYFKMLHFGVPKQAVKLKMEQEGLDASILDNPQQIVSIPQLSETNENQAE